MRIRILIHSSAHQFIIVTEFIPLVHWMNDELVHFKVVNQFNLFNWKIRSIEPVHEQPTHHNSLDIFCFL